MIPAFRALDWDTEAGKPLPAVWNTLEAKGMRLHPGELALWVGPPGGGKSALALAYAVQCQVPTLYVTLDMTRHMVTVKLGSLLTGKTNDQIKEDLNDPARREALREGIAATAGHLLLEPRTRPTPEEIVAVELAAEELLGEPPQLMILDNAMNVALTGESEWVGLRDLMQVMHWLAGDKEMSVLVLGHINLEKENLTRPAPLDKVKGQVTELPAWVASLCGRPLDQRLAIASLKNRHGPPDPTGRSYVELDWYPASGVIRDPTPRPTPGAYRPWEN